MCDCILGDSNKRRGDSYKVTSVKPSEEHCDQQTSKPKSACPRSSLRQHTSTKLSGFAACQVYLGHSRTATSIGDTRHVPLRRWWISVRHAARRLTVDINRHCSKLHRRSTPLRLGAKQMAQTALLLSTLMISHVKTECSLVNATVTALLVCFISCTFASAQGTGTSSQSRRALSPS
jgi:hypothetical protein